MADLSKIKNYIIYFLFLSDKPDKHAFAKQFIQSIVVQSLEYPRERKHIAQK